jgi:hypothetical protein
MSSVPVLVSVSSPVTVSPGSMLLNEAIADAGLEPIERLPVEKSSLGTAVVVVNNAKVPALTAVAINARIPKVRRILFLEFMMLCVPLMNGCEGAALSQADESTPR